MYRPTKPESFETLKSQQRDLLSGRRIVQMFPWGTRELSLHPGMERTETKNGVFHFNPKKVDRATIERLSGIDRENELLDLGPFSKEEILQRVHAGEIPLTLVERRPEGTEIRASAGTHLTVSTQIEHMSKNVAPGNTLYIENPLFTIHRRDS